MKLLLVRPRASVSSIRACPWACEVNSNSYWSDMNGLLCSFDFCSQPEPKFIPFKQLLPHRFPCTRSEVACPVILAHVKSLFYIGFCRQKSKCPRVHCSGVHRGENRRR